MSGTILVAVDDSAAAFQAARVAVDLAAALGDTLVAMSVLDGRPPPTSRTETDSGEQARAAAAALHHVAGMATRCGVTVETLLVHGQVAEQVLAQAERLTARFVVVGRFDRPGVRLPHIGRTAEQVLEFSDVPVVVVPVRVPARCGPDRPASRS